MLATCLTEFQREVEQTVERKFAHVFASLRAGEDVEIPILGGLPQYRDAEYRDGLQGDVVRALCARKWAESEAPAWMQPLLLREDDCIALLNAPETGRWDRSWLRVEYSRHLRGLDWHYERAIPFEKFCAQKYNTGSEPTSGVRKKRGRPRKLVRPSYWNEQY